ncbi:MAG: hypothetical protein ICV60_22910, partial [Pyrinomonadaceae bacterium]|nr:hypothetical protein [Pyrinomonadaceae bacterium]
CANDLDRSKGTAETLYDLNKAQFVQAAYNNYAGRKQTWVDELLKTKKWLA